MAGRRRDKDPVEGRRLRPTEIAVPSANGDVRGSEAGEPVGRLVREFLDELDAEDLRDEGGEDRGLVSGPGSHLEDPITRTGPDEFGHQRDDVGLRDRLPEADRERRIGIRRRPVPFGDVLVARNGAHRLEDPRVRDAPGLDLLLDHPAPEGPEFGLLRSERPPLPHDPGREGEADRREGGAKETDPVTQARRPKRVPQPPAAGHAVRTSRSD